MIAEGLLCIVCNELEKNYNWFIDGHAGSFNV